MCSLDDFGCGYSSLSLLRSFDIDIIKLDKVFFKDLSEKSKKIISALIALAKSIGVLTVAEGIETNKIEGGRFAYEIPCEEEGTLVMVFPNFSEQPVFTQPGKTVEIKADASHLKELEAEGTDDNKLMTAFRKQISSMSPQQTIAAAAEFVKHNPKSYVSAWLIRKYFILAPTPDYTKAKQLSDTFPICNFTRRSQRHKEILRQNVEHLRFLLCFSFSTFNLAFCAYYSNCSLYTKAN